MKKILGTSEKEVGNTGNQPTKISPGGRVLSFSYGGGFIPYRDKTFH
ncbi:MAG: hypothetical protein ACETWC_01295 [Acidobacteriota bacterium]